MRIGYRPDIDGLRAIAVLSVVLFHLGVPGVPGGFVGVDVFFVISGYLISKIIFAETAECRFSIVKFYERRARRILPAFFFVSLLTAYCAYRLFYPPEIVAFSKSLLASTFFLANMYFFATLNYFSPAADRLPLLHYWSLGVEEQFYLFFPVIIIAIKKFIPHGLNATIIVCLLASFLASGLLTHAHPTWTFYLLPCRAFELMIGSTLALPTIAAPRSAVWARVATITGLSALALCVFMFREQMDFPGFAAAIPCIGAALLIWGGTGQQTLPTQFLASLPMRAIGKISYSLYLVHWPIIIFGVQLLPDMDKDLRAVLLFVGSLVLATLSFYCIEQPVRFGRFWTQRNVFAFSVLALVLPSGIANDLIMKRGYPERFDAQVAHVVAFLQYDPTAQFRGGQCFLGANQGPSDFNQALCWPNSAKKNAILWGDSAAADLYAGLDVMFKKSGYSLGQATASACAPILGYENPARPFCQQFNKFVLAKTLREKPDIVILASSWLFNSDEHIISRHDQKFLEAMLDTLRNAGITTVVIGPQPYYNAPVPTIIANRLRAGNHSTTSDGAILALVEAADTQMQSISSKEHIRYVSILKEICPLGKCPMVAAGGDPMEFDVFHLDTQGSKFVANHIAPLILPPAQ